MSSLDVALARIIRHETARARKQCGVTLLLDIEAFYENIQHEKLISQGLQHHFPAVVLNGAMEIYQGPDTLKEKGCCRHRSGALKASLQDAHLRQD